MMANCWGRSWCRTFGMHCVRKIEARKQKVAAAANEVVSTEVFLKTLLSFSSGIPLFTRVFFFFFFVTAAERILSR